MKGAISRKRHSKRDPYWLAVARADKAFSLYIRKSAADKNGVVKCYCGRIVDWKEADASHYVGRRHMGTRYLPLNVHPSCRNCNRFQEGNHHVYALFLMGKYGLFAIHKTIPNELFLASYLSISQLNKSFSKDCKIFSPSSTGIFIIEDCVPHY